MKIDELIFKLQEFKKQHGNIPVCTTKDHEYWGSVERYIENWNICVSENAQPKGPKREVVKCVVIY